jgi:hypothetical protein
MAGTFSRKTRVVLSKKVVPPSFIDRDLNEAAFLFKKALIQNASFSELEPDTAVKVAMSGGLSSGSAEDTDGKKRTNSGGTPGMEDYFGYRYMPNEKYSPGKVLKLFPTQAQRDSMNKTPNFGYVEEEPMSIEEFTESLKKRPQITMSKYKVSPRNGEIDESTEEEINPFKFGKIEDEIGVKNLGRRKLSSLVRGGGLVARTAARFGVIVDELGKMRCPPGTPAANQFTDMAGSNCFGSPDSIIRASVNAARSLIEDDSSTRKTGKRIANFLFDWDNSPLGRTVWYDEDGNRIKNYRKWREAGGVAEGERWFVDGMARGVAELEAQDARISQLFDDLGVSRSETNMENNNDLVQTMDKLRKSGVINATLGSDKMGRPSDSQVRDMLITNLQQTPGWQELSAEDKNNLLKADTKRYYEIERGMVESFLDEVIKNPEHMKSITAIGYSYNSNDEASWNPTGIFGKDVMQAEININIPFIMKRQESMLPNLSADERLKIVSSGGINESADALAHNDFLLNANAYAGQMAAMIDGPRTHARQIMKHEIAHSIQGAAISAAIRDQIERNGFITIPAGKGKGQGLKKVTDPADLTSSDILKIMMGNASVDLEALQNAASRSETVAFLAGRYITELRQRGEPDGLLTLEIGAELWALRASGLIYGDDVDAALAWMDNIADGRYTQDRMFDDQVALSNINDSYTKATDRMRELGINTSRDEYVSLRREEIKSHLSEVSLMSDDELLDDIIDLREQVKVLGKQVKDNPKDFIADANYDIAYQKLKNSESFYKAGSSVNPATSRASKRMNDDLKRRMEERGIKTDEEIIKELDDKEIDFASETAKNYNLDRIVEEVASIDEILKDKDLPKERKDQLKKVQEEFKKEYINRRTSSPQYPISEEDAEKALNSSVKRITQKPSTKNKNEPATFRSHRQTLSYADKEREELFEVATAREREAVVELGDPNSHDIGRLLDPRTQFDASRSIQSRYRQAQKTGTDIKPNNRNMSSIDDQIENILAPALELMDKSSLKDTMEVEAEIVLPKDIDLDAVIPNDGFITGRMTTSREPYSPDKSAVPGPGNTPTEEVRKVVVRARAGNKGLFHNWSFDKAQDDGDQKLILPPGKLKVVDKADDGTIIVEVVEQKNTEEVLNDLARTSAPISGETKDNFLWRENINSKIVRSVGRSLHRKRKSGSYEKRKTSPEPAAKIEQANEVIPEKIKPHGQPLGEPVSREYASRKEVKDIASDTNVSSRYGTPQTREQRKQERESLQKEVISDIRAATDQNGDRSISLRIDYAEIDPEVADLVNSLTDEQLVDLVSNAGREFHLQFDSRPRVRVTEEELRPISQGLWYGFNGSGPIDPGLITPGLSSGSISSERQRNQIPGVGIADRNGISSGFQIDRASASRVERPSSGERTGLSSGSTVERSLSPGSLNKEPSIVTSKETNIKGLGMANRKTEVFEIDGKKIAFGVENDYDDDSIEVIPINPYVISGYSASSEEGRQIADDWIIARAMYAEDTNKNDLSYVDALLYAASRGDSDAQKELDSLAERGRERMQEIVRQEREEFEANSPFEKEQRISSISAEQLQDVDIDQIFLVHETKWDTQTDEDGNIIIKPASDYDLLGEDGEKLKDEDGDEYDLYRGSIHFALNHIVEGHMMRQGFPNSNIIVVPLRSVLEANPDSIDMLYPVDTFFTPAPGEGLKIPGAKVVRNDGQENLKSEVWKTMESMGATRSFSPGESYSTPGAEAVVANISEDLGLQRGDLHANTPHARYEKVRKKEKQSLFLGLNDLTKMGRNARIRIANNNRFAPNRYEAIPGNRDLDDEA